MSSELKGSRNFLHANLLEHASESCHIVVKQRQVSKSRR
jgi:hypothetical protein